MAWVNGDWTCDSTNAGYPYNTTAGVAAAFDPSGCATVWALRADVLMGYPHILAVFPPDPPAPGNAPRLTGFELCGMGAGFRLLDYAQGLSAPEEVGLTFCMDRRLEFTFLTKGVIP